MSWHLAAYRALGRNYIGQAVTLDDTMPICPYDLIDCYSSRIDALLIRERPRLQKFPFEAVCSASIHVENSYKTAKIKKEREREGGRV